MGLEDLDDLPLSEMIGPADRVVLAAEAFFQMEPQMWAARSEALSNVRGSKITVELDGRPATFGDVLDALRNDPEFRALLNQWLADVPYEAFRWEAPPVTASELSRPFECVVLEDRSLARLSDPEPFSAHFGSAVEGVVTFPNLGGDAVLVVPAPMTDVPAYAHLAQFVRRAPEPQRGALWKAVGEAMKRRVGSKAVWLSTAGAGVAWLHVRLDDRPKYYAFGPYRRLV